MRVLTQEAQDWADETIILSRDWRRKRKWQTAKGKVIVKLWYYFPDNRKRDTHNSLKIMLDCFEDAGIYVNDRYALPWVMDFEVDREYPRVEIEFEEVNS